MTTTPTRVLKLLSESIDQDIAKIETPTLSGASLFQQAAAVRQGRTLVSGDTQLLLWTKGEALLFEAMLGTIATTGRVRTRTRRPRRSTCRRTRCRSPRAARRRCSASRWSA